MGSTAGRLWVYGSRLVRLRVLSRPPMFPPLGPSPRPTSECVTWSMRTRLKGNCGRAEIGIGADAEKDPISAHDPPGTGARASAEGSSGRRGWMRGGTPACPRSGDKEDFPGHDGGRGAKGRRATGRGGGSHRPNTYTTSFVGRACLLYVTPDWAGDLVSAGPLALVHAQRHVMGNRGKCFQLPIGFFSLGHWPPSALGEYLSM